MSLITSKKVLTLILVLSKTENKVLLGMKKRGFGANKFNGFGGKVEPGETIEAGARRELLEEAEIQAIDLKKYGVLLFTFENDPVALETHIYITTEFEGEPKETEEMKPEWFSYDQIPFDQMWSDDKYWFPFILKNQRFTGHFHFGEDQKTILKEDLEAIDDELIREFDLNKITL